jgi:hypothetical protein
MKSKTQPQAPVDTTMVQTAFRLPRELHEQIKAAAGERGISEEIRRRLEASFGPEAGSDVQTRELGAVISQLAARMDEDYGAWHHDPFSFQAFKAGINLVMDHSRPKGEPVGKPKPNSVAEMMGEAGTPEQVGKSWAAVILRAIRTAPKGP